MAAWRYLVRFKCREEGAIVFGNLESLPAKPVYEGLKVRRFA